MHLPLAKKGGQVSIWGQVWDFYTWGLYYAPGACSMAVHRLREDEIRGALADGKIEV